MTVDVFVVLWISTVELEWVELMLCSCEWFEPVLQRFHRCSTVFVPMSQNRGSASSLPQHVLACPRLWKVGRIYSPRVTSEHEQNLWFEGYLDEVSCIHPANDDRSRRRPEGNLLRLECIVLASVWILLDQRSRESPDAQSDDRSSIVWHKNLQWLDHNPRRRTIWRTE